VDRAGNVFVADTDNDTIRKVTPDGVVTTLAGLAGFYGRTDGTGAEARFDHPFGVVVDDTGNVFVADRGNYSVRKVTPAGVVTTIANGNYDTDFSVYDVAVDSAGTVFFADADKNTIRKVAPNGVVSTLAGSPGLSGSADGTGSAARFYNPYGLTVDHGGNVIVADTNNHRIRKVTPSGVVTTIAGGVQICGQNGGANALCLPTDVAVDSAGNLFVTDENSVRTVAPNGVVGTVAGVANSRGSADGTGSAARFSAPSGLAADPSGNLFVADANNGTIRKLTAAGVVTTVAGTADGSGTADGVGSAARFQRTSGVAMDSAGNVLVADTYNQTIRKIAPDGTVTTLAGAPDVVGSADGTGASARFSDPEGLAVDSAGNAFVADRANNTIRKITPAGVVTTLAGSAGAKGHVDGTGSAARFYYPWGVAVDSAGNVFVADAYNNAVRKVTPAGVVTTVAASTDATEPAARLGMPMGVAVDSAGNVFVADTYNHAIRKVTPAGVVSTLAGMVGTLGTADGTGPDARFFLPRNLTVDGAGNVLVADTNSGTIRKVTPAGVVTTVVGTAGRIGVQLGRLPASLGQVFGVTVTSSGNLIMTTENAVLDAILP